MFLPISYSRVEREKKDVKPIFLLAQIQEFFLSYLINHKSSVNFSSFPLVRKQKEGKDKKRGKRNILSSWKVIFCEFWMTGECGRRIVFWNDVKIVENVERKFSQNSLSFNEPDRRST